MPGDVPSALCLHPKKHMLAAGFESGKVRFFNVDATKAGEHLDKHTRPVSRIFFSASGDCFYSAAEDGVLILFDVAEVSE